MAVSVVKRMYRTLPEQSPHFTTPEVANAATQILAQLMGANGSDAEHLPQAPIQQYPQLDSNRLLLRRMKELVSTLVTLKDKVGLG